MRNCRDVVTSVLDSRGCSSQSDLSGELEPAMATVRQSDRQLDRQSRQSGQTVRQATEPSVSPCKAASYSSSTLCSRSWKSPQLSHIVTVLVISLW